MKYLGRIGIDMRKKGRKAFQSAKKLEKNIMSLVPLGMIIYMRISNPGFMDILYCSIAGRILMTVCLILYGIALWIAEKITKISI